MPEPIVDPNIPPIVDPPPPPVNDPPPPPIEALDERGVPYKNRVAEYERKLADAQQREQLYQQQLGTYIQQQQTQQRPDPTSKFDAETVAFVTEVAQRVAQQTGHKLMTQAQLQESLSDVDLVNEARPIYARLKNNPIWGGADDLLVQDRALTEAKLSLAEKRHQAATQARTQQLTTDANRAQAAGATLPGATGGGPAPTAENAAVTSWMNIQQEYDEGLPGKRKLFKQLFPNLNINSPEGQAKFRKIATRAVEEM